MPRATKNSAERTAAFDETSWIQGEEYPVTTLITLPDKLEPGVYDVRIALTGPAGKPLIRLPISGDDGKLRYRLGTIRILPPKARQ